ncbi:hypothetical protein SAMN05192529_1366 [Arachidicoccus rhizosphaerae]|uniref:Uncharacterized protein n=1 Tax=Arachidicoccus rhizosphaerae TaxID=551991 RepID=A0A1H4CSX3_9BACT|nr:hypothetical protein SAMN05192529_1366 [Arachidicoccus rhizosphaerae]
MIMKLGFTTLKSANVSNKILQIKTNMFNG